MTTRALPRKLENRKKVQILRSFWRTSGVPPWCVLPYCCAAVVDWSVRSAPLLLYCFGGGLVSGWVVGASWVTTRALPRKVETRVPTRATAGPVVSAPRTSPRRLGVRLSTMQKFVRYHTGK